MKAKLVLSGQYLTNPSDEYKEVIKYYERVVENLNKDGVEFHYICTPEVFCEIHKPLEIVISEC